MEFLLLVLEVLGSEFHLGKRMEFLLLVLEIGLE